MKFKNIIHIVYILVIILLVILYLTKKDGALDTEKEIRIIEREKIKLAESVNRENLLREEFVDEKVFENDSDADLLAGIYESLDRSRSFKSKTNTNTN